MHKSFIFYSAISVFTENYMYHESVGKVPDSKREHSGTRKVYDSRSVPEMLF